MKLKEVVEETDPEAFVSVTDVREVMGKGFTKERIKVTIYIKTCNMQECL